LSQINTLLPNPPEICKITGQISGLTFQIKFDTFISFKNLPFSKFILWCIWLQQVALALSFNYLSPVSGEYLFGKENSGKF